MKLDRRGFIAALFGGVPDSSAAIFGIRYASLISDWAEPARYDFLNRWWRHYCYFFQAYHMGPEGGTMELAVDRNFLLSGVAWSVPPLTVIEIQHEGKTLAQGMLPGFIRPGVTMPLPTPFFVPAGTSFTVILRNPGRGSSAALALSGQQEITEQEALVYNANNAECSTGVDADFEEDDSE